jgi:hypothetical protein
MQHLHCITRYITLGSPHAPPPAGVEGVVDQTRGILNWCQDAAPGAYHPEVRGSPALAKLGLGKQLLLKQHHVEANAVRMLVLPPPLRYQAAAPSSLAGRCLPLPGRQMPDSTPR